MAVHDRFAKDDGSGSAEILEEAWKRVRLAAVRAGLGRLVESGPMSSRQRVGIGVDAIDGPFWRGLASVACRCAHRCPKRR